MPHYQLKAGDTITITGMPFKLQSDVVAETATPGQIWREGEDSYLCFDPEGAEVADADVRGIPPEGLGW